MKTLSSVLMVCALTGCASITMESVQRIQVETADATGALYVNAACEFKSPLGEAQGLSGQRIQIRKDSQDMTVRCVAQGLPDALGTVRSRANIGMTGNLLLGGAVGLVVDHHKANGYNYPTALRLVFGQDRFYDRSEEQQGEVLLGVDVKAMDKTQAAASSRPVSSNFAPLNDPARVPRLSDNGQRDYAAWLGWMAPRAFALSSKGAWYAAHGASTDPRLPVDPTARALALCARRNQGVPCRLYAVDDLVVWRTDTAQASSSDAYGAAESPADVPPR
ncbi:MAG: hypothetical protein RLZZ401_725 [Pseudomonadota bacterium]|jgi:hypothetical protein